MKVLRIRKIAPADAVTGQTYLCVATVLTEEGSMYMQPGVPEFYDTETGETTEVAFVNDYAVN